MTSAKLLLAVLALCGAGTAAVAQDTRILGFADVTTTYNPDKDKVSFGLGEQDLFITSDVSDRISFLGETVFRYNAASPTAFAVSVERIILKYNLKGNHNFLIGKHHTPINYWNDTYHHGRVFFPTIFRPAAFNDGLLPLHTLGASLQGQNLGDIGFGYDLMVGNGLGSGDDTDNNLFKSVTLAAHIKPLQGMRIGVSSYTDRIAAGSKPHHAGGTVREAINQQMFTGSVALFRREYELLAESSYITNHTDSLGGQHTLASYVYAGARILPKLAPKLVLYGRYDNIRYDKQEQYFQTNEKQVYIGGLRYEFNYLAVAKLEFQHTQVHPIGKVKTTENLINAQFAIGF